MEFAALNEARRSVRAYKDTALNRATIEDILYHGTRAPSGSNRQPWYFVVVEDPALKAKIGDLVVEKVGERAQRTADVMKQAPALVVVYDRIGEDGGPSKLFDYQSVGACMQNICLRAVDKGLGSLWIGFICIAAAEISELLGMGDKQMMGAIAIGTPDEIPAPRPRADMATLVEWR